MVLISKFDYTGLGIERWLDFNRDRYGVILLLRLLESGVYAGLYRYVMVFLFRLT